MDLQTFKERFQKLQNIPDTEIEHLLLLAEHLSDADREDMFRELEVNNRQWQAESDETEKKVQALDTLASRLEAGVMKISRDAKEQAEEQGAVSAVEQKIASQFS
jgi:hypothetical protein